MKHWVPVIIALIIAFPVRKACGQQAETPEPPPPASVAPSVQQADVLMKDGKWSATQKLLGDKLAALGDKATPEERRALSIKLADAYEAEAEALRIEQTRPENAIAAFEKACEINRLFRPRSAPHDLYEAGFIYARIGQTSKALDYTGRCRSLYQQAGDMQGEGDCLNATGSIYYMMGDNEKSLDYHLQALPLYRKANSVSGEAAALSNIGSIYSRIGQPDKALTYYEQALPLRRQVKDVEGEAVTLNNIGRVYDTLRQPDKSLSYFLQSLPLRRLAKDTRGEANTLNNIGIAYFVLAQFDKALDYEEQALVLRRQVKDVAGEATTLSNIGRIQMGLKQYDKALSSLEQSLALKRRSGDRMGEAITLGNIGAIYYLTNVPEKALSFYEQAAPLYTQAKYVAGEADLLNSMMLVWNERSDNARNPSLAIFLGKKSINLYQTVRKSVGNINPGALQIYTKSIESAYRKLADILVEQGRFTEAQEVLGLLKQREFAGFVRRDAVETGEKTVTLNKLEEEAEKGIREQVENALAISTEIDDLTNKSKAGPLTPDEEKRLSDLIMKRTAANEAVARAFNSLNALFTVNASRVAVKEIDLRGVESFNRTLKTLARTTGQRPLAIYTLVGEKKLRFVLVRADGTRVARESDISATDLNKRIFAFRNVLKDPLVDPRPRAKALYDLIIQPIAKDIRDSRADTLMWSLDGALRYIPFAALSPDGVHYLVESKTLQQAIFTPVKTGGLTDEPSPLWKPLGLGVTRGQDIEVNSRGGLRHMTFPALPGVAAEMRALNTALPGGEILLNDQFERKTLEETLTRRGGTFGVVHIATHFYLDPIGDKSNSFLLLGDGQKLTLADIENLSAIFNETDLITLSACDTALGVSASGSGAADSTVADRYGAEFEGMAALAQDKGAAAVLATLWPVSDASTAELMQDFYRQRRANPRLTKSEALRRAQVALLMGNHTRSGSLASPAGNKDGFSADARKFVTDPKRPFAHPYYWAGFVLFGNWR